MALVDLSHVVEDGMVTCPDLPAPRISDFMSREESADKYAEGTRFQIGRMDMVANTGTYMDSPFHRYAEGRDMAALELERTACLPGRLFPGRQSGRAIGPEQFGDEDLSGCAVLVHTGWDRHWNSEAYFRGHPYLTREAAEHLRDAGAALVGIDSLNIDTMEGGERPVHSVLLAAGIPVVEHLCNLGAIDGRPFRFHAAPVAVRGLGSFPVRAFAEVLD